MSTKIFDNKNRTCPNPAAGVANDEAARNMPAVSLKKPTEIAFSTLPEKADGKVLSKEDNQVQTVFSNLSVILTFPIKFNCQVRKINEVDKIIEAKSIIVPKKQPGSSQSKKTKYERKPFWKKRILEKSYLFEPIHGLFATENKYRVASIYEADGENVRYLTGYSRFIFGKSESKAGYTISHLTLYLFETGIGFLSLQLLLDDPVDVRLENISVLVHSLRNPYRDYFNHFPQGEKYPKAKKTRLDELKNGGETIDEIVRSILDITDNNQSFFNYLYEYGGTKKTVSVYSLVFGNINVASSDPSCNADLYTRMLLKKVTDLSNHDKVRENCSTTKCFEGMLVGFSPNTLAITRFKESTMSIDIFYNELDNLYLPMLILTLQQKYAALKFSSTQNITKNRKNFCDQIVLFNENLMIRQVSNSKFQKIYDFLLKQSKIDKLLEECSYKYKSILTRYNDYRHVQTERTTGIISIVFAIIGMFSILNDGMQIIDRVGFPEYHLYIKSGLIGICLVIFIFGLGGLMSVMKSTR